MIQKLNGSHPIKMSTDRISLTNEINHLIQVLKVMKEILQPKQI